jgi:hypothetical protein
MIYDILIIILNYFKSEDLCLFMSISKIFHCVIYDILKDRLYSMYCNIRMNNIKTFKTFNRVFYIYNDLIHNINKLDIVKISCNDKRIFMIDVNNQIHYQYFNSSIIKYLPIKIKSENYDIESPNDYSCEYLCIIYHNIYNVIDLKDNDIIINNKRNYKIYELEDINFQIYDGELFDFTTHKFGKRIDSSVINYKHNPNNNSILIQKTDQIILRDLNLKTFEVINNKIDFDKYHIYQNTFIYLNNENHIVDIKGNIIFNKYEVIKFVIKGNILFFWCY